MLEYDGTGFAGSQFQGTARTVQGELERAWSSLTGEAIRWNFAGRTDAGVNARGQVANGRTASRHSTATVQRALNALLPEDLAVREVWEVPWSFHARFSATRRDYRYVILNRRYRSPLERRRALHVPEPLDEVAMHQAVRLLLGEHDFRAFGSVEHGGTVRHCYHATCYATDVDDHRMIYVELAANGFLRHMVRSVVGTLLLVGRGRQAPGTVEEILARRERAAAGPTAPPHGLYLESVRYGEEIGRQ